MTAVDLVLIFLSSMLGSLAGWLCVAAGVTLLLAFAALWLMSRIGAEK